MATKSKNIGRGGKRAGAGKKPKTLADSFRKMTHNTGSYNSEEAKRKLHRDQCSVKSTVYESS